MAKLLDAVEVYASGNKSHHVLPPLASIANEVLLTSVGNVGLWAHKLESNTCIYSHREAGLQTGSQFVATAIPAVQETDGQVTLNGYFISATAKGVDLQHAASDDVAVTLQLSDAVQQLVSHPSLAHPVIVSKEWTLASLIVTAQPSLAATMAASTPSPAWLTSSAVVGCLVWQQQLLLISKAGHISSYTQASDGTFTVGPVIKLQLHDTQQLVAATASETNLYILTADGVVSRLRTLTPSIIPLRHTIDPATYQISSALLATPGNQLAIVLREASGTPAANLKLAETGWDSVCNLGNQVVTLLLDGHYGSLLQTSQALTLVNKKDHLAACIAVGSYVCIATTTKASSSAVTGLAALLGSVAAPAEDTLAKLLDPKKTASLEKFGSAFNKWLTAAAGVVTPCECEQLVRHILSEQRYLASDALKQLLATGTLNPWDYPTFLQDLAVRQPGLVVFALQHTATVLEADFVSALLLLLPEDDQADLTLPIAVVMAACQHPLQESALVPVLRTPVSSLALRLANLVASAMELNATQHASSQRQAELSTLVLLATSVVDANLLHLMASADGRGVAARLHTATAVQLAMGVAMETVGGMVHSVLQASKHPLKREALLVPFEVVQLPLQ